MKTKAIEQTVKIGEPVFRNKKILVVDDIQKWLDVSKENLKYYGCEDIITAENPETAYIKYTKQKPEIILTDINFDTENLEDMQGCYLIKKLRDEKYQNPIIAMSSLTGDIKQKTFDFGADFFINKKDFIEEFDSFVRWYKLNKKL